MKAPENDALSSGEDYRALVLSLFEDRLTLVLGGVGTTIAALLTAFATGSVMLFALTGAMLLVTLARYGISWLFVNRRHLRAWSNGAARRWENLYTVGAVAMTTLLGFWCIYSHLVLNDNFASFASVAVTFANLVGISGRNFAMQRLVDWQIWTAGGGMVVSIVYADIFYILLAALMLPFVLSIRKIAARQRQTLNRAFTERRHARHLAEQMDTTLNNIQDGICMFDSLGRLEVANSQTCDMFGVSRSEINRITFGELINLIADRQFVPPSDLSILARTVQTSRNSEVNYRFRMGREDGRTLRVCARPTRQGGVIATFEDVTREEQDANRIERLERFDRLTGLINRKELITILDRESMARRSEESCAVMLINLNRFSEVNDLLGYRQGDALLIETTNRLGSILPAGYHLARYGGDEFAIVIRGVHAEKPAIELAQRVIEVLDVPYKLEQRMVQIGCRVGISVGRRVEDTAELLLKQADMALFRARTNKDENWMLFDRSMAKELADRRQLEADLKAALDRGQFEAHFQPIVSLADRRTTLCEALLRWRHPTRGFVSPADFIPLAEETGQITAIGEWMLFEACSVCSRWPGDVGVAVNLSPVQFRSGNLVETVRSVLLRTGLEPSRLELEITESLMLENLSDTISKLDELKSIGVKVSLDDFGTGYSSLSNVNNLPLDKLKIDRSFVDDLAPNSKSLTLVQAISSMGEQLGLTVVIEGIENHDQLHLVMQQTRVSHVQGFHFSKPMPDKETTALLTAPLGADHPISRKFALEAAA